ncbi:MAG: hypothetical protein KKC21_01565 [Nitrospinae bacterium]|nr:hypothetical protein [Nitrospinota bacterium]
MKELENKESELIKSHKDVEPALLSGFISHETDNLVEKCRRHETSTILFSCMTIEGFINNYGVRRLGEAFYKKNLERLGITEKLSLLILACIGKAIESNAVLMKKARALFDARNSLVHPKTKEFNHEKLDQYVNDHPRDCRIEEYITDMEIILSELCKLDSDIKRDFEFRLPAEEPN